MARNGRRGPVNGLLFAGVLMVFRNRLRTRGAQSDEDAAKGATDVISSGIKKDEARGLGWQRK